MDEEALLKNIKMMRGSLQVLFKEKKNGGDRVQVFEGGTGRD
jgi:hypothetical protein